MQGQICDESPAVAASVLVATKASLSFLRHIITRTMKTENYLCRGQNSICADQFICVSQYAASWMPDTALPLGSFIFLKDSSHSRAMDVEHATEDS